MTEETAWIQKRKKDPQLGDRPLAEGRRRGSSVLIPLIETESGYEILFEVRAHDLPAQPGEVCLPGGRIEAGESPLQAAVRETSEELGIDPEQIEVIASLDGMIGPGGRPVWPFVGVLHEYADTWSEDEVDHVFRVPLSWFAKDEPERYETTLHTVPEEGFPFDRIPGGRNYPWRQRYYEVLFYHWPGEVIWGLTAKLLDAWISRMRECGE